MSQSFFKKSRNEKIDYLAGQIEKLPKTYKYIMTQPSEEHIREHVDRAADWAHGVLDKPGMFPSSIRKINENLVANFK